MLTRANPVATLFPIILAGLLAGLSYWLELASRPQKTVSDGKSRHDPDYIVEQFEVRRFSPQGTLQHTLIADLMRHYPDDDSTVILAPRLTYHGPPPTFISANEARLTSKGKHVELIDAVRIVRPGAAGKPDTVLTTSRLHAWPDDEIAKTDVPVTITQGLTSVNGSGLNVDNKTSIYVLEGPVHGVFLRGGGSPATVRTAGVPQSTPRPAAIPKATAKPKAQPKPKPRSKPKPISSR